MSEYRIDIKVRNNIILKKLEEKGYSCLGEFCRLNGMMSQVGVLGDILNMKKSPLDSEGRWRKSLENFCFILECAPMDLFTDAQMNTVLSTNKRSLQVKEAEMRFMIENVPEQKLLDEIISEDQRKINIDKVLKCLTPRERMVVEMRMGLGEYDHEHTFQEISDIFGITNERIRQIEAKAYRKLRHPLRSNILLDREPCELDKKIYGME
jgi:RNA polymerase sigma factor (sigma-70 family)